MYISTSLLRFLTAESLHVPVPTLRRGRFIPTFVGHSDATMDSSDSSHSLALHFVLDL